MRSRTRFALGAGLALLAYAALARRGRWPGFKRRVVLITGGSRGLGLALAREFAARGAYLALLARDGGELAAARQDLERRGARVVAIPCDVTDPVQVESAVRKVEDELGPVDVLVNNAGTIQVGPLDSVTLEDFEESLKVHFWAPLYATLAVLPGMRRMGDGRIVNITSVGGKIAVPHLLPYASGKFALVGLSEGLRAELAREDIAVTTVVPGMMRTGSPVNAKFKGQHRLEYAWFTTFDSLPLLSMSAPRAARIIAEAARKGEPEVVLTLLAKAAVRLHGLAPSLTQRLAAVAHRLLPGPGGIGREARRGRDSESALTRSPLTALTRMAAARNNEL